ncbi:MAG: hypothetical protein A2Z45_06810 [Chloroflexi bacterium RBG_19FT_COMBO_55_16]|nr:MAG: hypothetical protein A2Z45_06810 [Chloroflexi bacterium RBG_19FT_COMBO_55_16]
MTKTRLSTPIALPIAIIIFLVLGLIAGPFIRSRATEEQLADNVLLSALPFILIVVAIILAFITLIAIIARLLSNNISPRIFSIVERILIAGIVLGVLGMFQPWVFLAYKYGFLLLLFSTLSFIVWSHIVPRRADVQEGISPVVPSQPEKREVEGERRV